jgi:deoxyribodipyrimidine photo-lyase
MHNDVFTKLPTPEIGREAAELYVREHLSDLVCDPDDIVGSPRFVGGRSAAITALSRFRVNGYAARRNEVAPRSARGASMLSPYIRHGLLSLPELWEHVAGGPARDVSKFRDELLWQEYARHLYARLGVSMAEPVRYIPRGEGTPSLDRSMACIDMVVGELEEDGWMVNQTRMWLAGHWTNRLGGDWRNGEDFMFTHLLDGSRAANRLGWQWTVGAGTSKQYSLSRWQVNKRAPGTCDGCVHRHRCPIERWPAEDELASVASPNPLVRSDPDPAATGGPTGPLRRRETVDAVWVTAESLGPNDPALQAHPDKPAVFVFDHRLLARLRLSAKRLVFLLESVADLHETHPAGVTVFLGDPALALADFALAATFAPVPGWKRLSARLELAEIHPWPWLRRPGPGSVASFSAWHR